ncbi:MAG: T9SS type A sorting domain-containing protein [Saprospiraceae bacterium]
MPKMLLSFLFISLTSVLFSAVNPIPMGRASNIYTIINPNQNQVYADPVTGIVVFIHQHDVTIWGGGSPENGKFRYDISTDGGITFTTDIGVLNNTHTLESRFPQITGYNPNSSNMAANTELIYWGMTIDANDNPDGHVAGNGVVTTMKPVNFSENYLFQSFNTYKPGGLCEGKSGEFWLVEADHDDTKFIDFISFTKGTYNNMTNAISWTVPFTPRPAHQSTPAKIMEPGPDMAFAPNGLNGWAAFGGEVTGSTTGVYAPVFYQTTDGGVNWSDEIFINFNSFNTITSRLNNAFVGASNDYGMIGGFDLTVDAAGNPHLLTVVGHVDDFVEQRGDYARMLVDLTTKDGGLTWEVLYIAPILTTQGAFGNFPSVEMNNYCQVARSADGNYIFYSWVDQIIRDGNDDLIYNDLLAPNLRSAGYRITDGYRTCISKVSDLDFVWEGRALFPTVSPVVLGDENSGFKLPTVSVEMLTNEPSEPCQFYYFGNEAIYFGNGFMPFADYDPETYLQEDASCNAGTALAIADATFQLTSFEQQAILNWEVEDADLIECLVQRKTQNGFETVARIPAKRHTNAYQFIDHELKTDTDYYYRLQFVTSNQQSIFSDTKHVRLKKETPTFVEIAPNPAQDVISVHINSELSENSECRIFNSTGQLVLKQSLRMQNQLLPLNRSQLPAGIYLIQVQNGDETRLEKLVLN